MSDDLITIAQAAEEFGLGLSFFYKHVNAGDIKPVDGGYPVRLRRGDVVAFLAAYDPYANRRRVLPDGEAVDLMLNIELGYGTAAEAARVYGISEATLSRWRSGERRPKLKAAFEAALALADLAVATMRDLEADDA